MKQKQTTLELAQNLAKLLNANCNNEAFYTKEQLLESLRKIGLINPRLYITPFKKLGWIKISKVVGKDNNYNFIKQSQPIYFRRCQVVIDDVLNTQKKYQDAYKRNKERESIPIVNITPVNTINKDFETITLKEKVVLVINFEEVHDTEFVKSFIEKKYNELKSKHDNLRTDIDYGNNTCKFVTVILK